MYTYIGVYARIKKHLVKIGPKKKLILEQNVLLLNGKVN